jgi:hypothetical protein
MGHIYAEQNTLSTTAEQVFPASTTTFRHSTGDRPLRVALKNTDASIAVYLGPSTVTSSNGFKLGAGESISFDVTATQDLTDLYVVAASGTPVLGVLVIGAQGV